MKKILLPATACLLVLPVSAGAPASPLVTKKSGTLERGCGALGEVKVCFDSSQTNGALLVRVAGKRTPIFLDGPDGAAPYEIERRDGQYRVKIGAPSRSDVPFFAYTEVVFRQAGRSFRVERYVIASDAKCEGSPDIRMIYEFDLGRRTLTSILAPPWSSDGKVHRFERSADFESADLFRLSAWDFINQLGDLPGATAVQRLCSA